MARSKLVIGCGYLGERVADRWLRQGDAVCALTRSPKRAEQLRARGLRPIVGDIMEPESLRQLADAETVLFAVGFDRSSSWSQRDVYVTGLRNALRELSGRIERWISISSTSVYGQSAGEWVDESSPTDPARENGRVVLQAEQSLWESFARDASARRPGANVLRLAGIYGPGRLLQRVEAVQSGAPIDGHPEGWLNLIHADDAATAVLACEARGRPGETYLVCDDRPVRRREYYETLARLLGAPSPRFSGAETDTSRTAGLNKRCRNQRLRDKLMAELAFPSIDEGLPDALRGDAACGPAVPPRDRIR